MNYSYKEIVFDDNFLAIFAVPLLYFGLVSAIRFAQQIYREENKENKKVLYVSIPEQKLRDFNIIRKGSLNEF